MQEREQVELFTPREIRQLGKLEDRFLEAGVSCYVDIFEIAHDFDPGPVTDEARKYDVVTLELTRGVVQAGLNDDESRVLKRNEFWRKVVESLRGDKDGKLIRGIEVNQTARIGWKRLSLTQSDLSLYHTNLTVEVSDPGSLNLLKYMSKEEAEALLKYNWVSSDNQETALKVFRKALKSYDMMKAGKIKKDPNTPLSFPPNIRLIHIDTEKDDGEDPFTTVFLKPPDQSLVQALTDLQTMFENTPLDLTEDERGSLSRDVMMKFILSHAELKDAQEILLALYQSTKKSGTNEEHATLHIGGADHAPAIEYVFKKYLQGSSIQIRRKPDPRFQSEIMKGSVLTFLGSAIPFEERVGGISIKGFEVYGNADRIVESTSKAIYENFEEFERHVLIERIINLDLGQSALSSFSDYNNMFALESELYSLTTGELEEILSAFRSEVLQ